MVEIQLHSFASNIHEFILFEYFTLILHYWWKRFSLSDRKYRMQYLFKNNSISDHEFRQNNSHRADSSDIRQSEETPLLHTFPRETSPEENNWTSLTVSLLLVILISGIIIGVYLLIIQSDSGEHLFIYLFKFFFFESNIFIPKVFTVRLNKIIILI